MILRHFLLLLFIVGVYSTPQLTVKNNQFKIVQFTDLHYDERLWLYDYSMNIERAILDYEKPDLVVVTGDVLSFGIYGCITSIPWMFLTKPMVERKIPWMFTIGNHDTNCGDLTPKEVVELDMSYSLSLTKIGPHNVSGISNYFVSVENNESLSFFIWMIDTEGGDFSEYSGMLQIHVDYIKETMMSFTRKYGKTFPFLLFTHKPIGDMKYIFENNFANGTYGESMCIDSDVNVVEQLKPYGLVYVGCGHLHENDLVASYSDVTLAFGRKTGAGAVSLRLPYGATVITVNLPFSIDVHVREHDGKVAILQQHYYNETIKECGVVSSYQRIIKTCLYWIGICLVLLLFVFLLRKINQKYKELKQSDDIVYTRLDQK
jgi:predicted MPP superfamily phosphohydrolase